MTNKNLPSSPQDFLLYNTPDGDVKISVLLKNETIWLSQKAMAHLFDCSSDNISLHLKNVFKSGELEQNSVTEDFSVTADDGKNYRVKHYNLDAIISVGYRVNSLRGTQFRIWATKQLKEYIIKGFVINDERLKNPNNPFGEDYFERLEEKIRDIRSSERRFYQKITDIYITSVDYDKNSDLTKEFFATVQNKMHFGIHGKTAAEVIASRADSKKPNMGITCILENNLKKSDIFVAKNYLTEKEIFELNLIVEQYLAFATLQAQNKRAMTMQDWILKLDDFLRLNEKEILQHKGKISKDLADKMAEDEYKIFKQKYLKNYESDFDKITKFIEGKK
ncbi:MAG: virulence RhuM family protein [Pseudomonadota bacterium]